LFSKRWFLWLLVFSVLGPQVANQAGWFTAEIGRQPWIVYGYLRTSEGLSKTVEANQVLTSLIMFGLIYALLFAVFIFLLDQKIRKGPSGEGEADLPGRPGGAAGLKRGRYVSGIFRSQCHLVCPHRRALYRLCHARWI
jgi:cytochrome bd-type quinol oxidase subunit 1